MSSQEPQDNQEATSSISPTQNNPAILPDDDFLKDLVEPAKPSADSVITPEGDIQLPLPAVQPKEPVTDKESLDNAKMFMGLREIGQGALIAWYADGDIWQWEQYKYSPAGMQQLSEAWAPLLKKKNIHVGPAGKILSLEIMHAVPIAQLVRNNRKYRKEAEQLREEAAVLRRELERAQSMQGQAPGPAQPQMSARYNNKNAWKIDELGRFVHGADGSSKSYIKADQRTERPRLPQDYEMLIKYNDKDFVHRVLDLPNQPASDEEHTV